jgi:hypothetical protein
MYKDYNSQFNLICEEETTRFRNGGFLNGDFCAIRKDAINHPRIKERGSQYIDKLKEFAQSNLPLKVCAVKSERPETQHDLYGTGSLVTTVWLDIVQEAAPGLFVNPLSLPAECVDLLLPDGNNWSPKHPEEWVRQDNSIIKPQTVNVKDTELQQQTMGNNTQRNLIMKNINNALGKEARDGRDQVDKPKESTEPATDEELISEAYETLIMEKKVEIINPNKQKKKYDNRLDKKTQKKIEAEKREKSENRSPEYKKRRQEVKEDDIETESIVHDVDKSTQELLSEAYDTMLISKK